MVKMPRYLKMTNTKFTHSRKRMKKMRSVVHTKSFYCAVRQTFTKKRLVLDKKSEFRNFGQHLVDYFSAAHTLCLSGYITTRPIN